MYLMFVVWFVLAVWNCSWGVVLPMCLLDFVWVCLLAWCLDVRRRHLVRGLGFVGLSCCVLGCLVGCTFAGVVGL